MMSCYIQAKITEKLQTITEKSQRITEDSQRITDNSQRITDNSQRIIDNSQRNHCIITVLSQRKKFVFGLELE
jgi:cell division protein FtsL